MSAAVTHTLLIVCAGVLFVLAVNRCFSLIDTPAADNPPRLGAAA